MVDATAVTFGHIEANDLRLGLRRILWAAAALSVAVLSLLSPSGAAPLTSQEARGKQVFLTGGSPGGDPIFALVGRSSIKVPAGVLPCANCHGRDGLGRPEGGVFPSNITWGHLTKPYGHQHRDGRQHPAFDEGTVSAAIASGLDPAGNMLAPAMPRYLMPEEELDALVAYLRRLETDFDPGLTETTIRIGSVLPSRGALGALGESVAAILKAYFDDINLAGGLYGRQIEFTVVEYSEDKEATLANARRLIDRDEVFAVVGAFAVGMEQDLLSVFENAQVPHIGPFTLFAGHSRFPGSSTFFVLPGLTDQARALVDFAALERGLRSSAIAVVLGEGDGYAEIARAIERQGQKHGWPAPPVIHFGGSSAVHGRQLGDLKEAGVEAVFYFGPAKGLAAFSAGATALDWSPYLFLSGLLAGQVAFELPRSFDGKVFLAYPMTPSDRTRGGIAEIEKLRASYSLPKGHLATQVSAYAAAKVLTEGLRRSGRALSRTSLVEALESLSRFDTGLTRPVSFGPNRRVGALGAHILSIDLKNRAFRSDARWIRLD